MSALGCRFNRSPQHIVQEEQSEEADDPGNHGRHDPAQDDVAKDAPADPGYSLQNSDTDNRSESASTLRPPMRMDSWITGRLVGISFMTATPYSAACAASTT